MYILCTICACSCVVCVLYCILKLIDNNGHGNRIIHTVLSEIDKSEQIFHTVVVVAAAAAVAIVAVGFWYFV